MYFTSFSAFYLFTLPSQVETSWADELRRNSSIEVSDIKKVTVTDVRLQQIVQNKYAFSSKVCWALTFFNFKFQEGGRGGY